MAKVLRPIQFDNPRKTRRNTKARVAKRLRDQRRRSVGGDLYYQTFMWRLHQEWLMDDSRSFLPILANDDW